MSTQANRSAALLSLRGLDVEFRGRSDAIRAVAWVDLELAGSRVPALVGESGLGKSATALALLAARRETGAAP